jgi:hypothetical protein
MEDREEWEVVEPDPEAAAPTATESVKIAAKDKKIKAHLLQCIPDDILMQVAKKKTGKEVWESLKARFVRADHVKDARMQTLKSEFDAVQMKEHEPLDQVVGKLTTLSVKYNSLRGVSMMWRWCKNYLISCRIATSPWWPVSSRSTA